MDTEAAVEKSYAEIMAEHRRTKAIQIAERALQSVEPGLKNESYLVAMLGSIGREIEFLLLDNERKQLEIDGLTGENEKLRTSIAGNEREVPVEVTVAEQTRALLEVLHECQHRAAGGRLRSLILFWREGREVFVRAASRGIVARPGDREPTMVGMHGNFPWAAYFDGKADVTIRFGTLGTTNVLWERLYRVGAAWPLPTVRDAVLQAAVDFDRARVA